MAKDAELMVCGAAIVLSPVTTNSRPPAPDSTRESAPEVPPPGDGGIRACGQ
jgi:hypothetical protein